MIPLPVAAAAAGLDYNRAWRAVASGRCPSERRGGRIVVDPDALRALAGAAAS